MKVKELLEAVTTSGDEIEAGDMVISRSPGSKGLKGRVLTIDGDKVVVDFRGNKQAVPLNHLTKVQINEDVSQISVLVKLLKRDCAPFLSLGLEMPLLRGIKDKSSSVASMGRYIRKGTVRNNRTPTDMTEELHDILDNYFKNEFGIKGRSNTLFTTFSSKVAGEYGNSIYYIFPIGSFEYIWSSIIQDAYYQLEGGLAKIKDETLAELVNEVMKNQGHINKKGDPRSIALLNTTERHLVVKELLDSYGDKLYTNKNLKAAQRTKSEIMLACDQYYAIDSFLLAKEFGVSSEDLMDALRS